MSTIDLIYEQAKALPGPLQTEALHFVDYLLTRQEAKTGAAAWAKFAVGQLQMHYASTDSIYDDEAGELVAGVRKASQPMKTVRPA